MAENELTKERGDVRIYLDVSAQREGAYRSRTGATLADVAIVLGVVAILLSIFAPTVQRLRTAARAATCRSHLRQIGVALETYHDRHLGLPPGVWPSDYTKTEGGGATWSRGLSAYGWSAFLLSDLGYEQLASDIDFGGTTLPSLLESPVKSSLLETPLGVFRCPADRADDTTRTAPLPDSHRMLGDPDRTSLADVRYGGSSSYVANAGYFGTHHPLLICSPADLGQYIKQNTGPNNGLFDVASHLHYGQIPDGRSTTIAVGERAWYQGSATWVGTRDAKAAHIGGPSTVLGRVFYRVNELPASVLSSMSGRQPRLVTRANRLFVAHIKSSRHGFGSYHAGGSHFLMADGAVRFIDEQVDFNNTTTDWNPSPFLPIPRPDELGVFQKLGIRNDSMLSDQ